MYADRVGVWYVAQKTADYRKKIGLYFTPVPVADFMAEQMQWQGELLRILDPAAGAGILACATVEAVVSGSVLPKTIELVAHEIESGLQTVLSAVFDYLVQWCGSNHGVQLLIRLYADDFVMAHAEALQRLGTLISYDSADQNFDVVIVNPPYFKINKSDPRAVAASTVVHGQPNIYGLFMAISAALLKQGGEFIFITPRSFASGPYFRKFRESFFATIRPMKMHLFHSRRDAFGRDEILQENIIFSGVRQDHWFYHQTQTNLVISSSAGVHNIDSTMHPMALR